MSCIYQIRECMENCTATEKKLAVYILKNPEEVTQSSAQTLAQNAGVSPAAVVRFSHKLGYKGFTALKVDLARDSAERISNFENGIFQQDSMQVISRKVKDLNGSLQSQTYRQLNPEQVERAVHVLLHCRNLCLFGAGGAGVVCLDFMEKLARIARVGIYRRDFRDQLATAAHLAPEDAVLAVSYSGKAKDTNAAVRLAKKAGAKVIAITPRADTPLAKLADILLPIPVAEEDLQLGAIAVRNASLFLTDLLYLGIARQETDRTKVCLRKTEAALQGLREAESRPHRTRP